MTKNTLCTQCHQAIQGPAVAMPTLDEEKRIRCVHCAIFGDLKEKINKLKLPIPNPYGTTVKVTKYNEIIDKILKLIEEERI